MDLSGKSLHVQPIESPNFNRRKISKVMILQQGIQLSTIKEFSR